LAVGNIVGSNIFNIFCILGVSAVIRPLPMRAACNLDIAATILSSLLLFLFMFVGRRPRLMDRWEGAVSLILYAGYLAFLVVRG